MNDYLKMTDRIQIQIMRYIWGARQFLIFLFGCDLAHLYFLRGQYFEDATGVSIKIDTNKIYGGHSDEQIDVKLSVDGCDLSYPSCR